jgi:hypothetical protein
LDKNNINNINKTLFISKIKIKWPYNYDEIEVGDKIWKLGDWNATADDRIRRLEEQASKNQDIIVAVLGVNRKIRHRRRYITLEVNGTETFVGQGNRIYKEYFTDTEFKDAAETDADWNTTQGACVF